MRRLLGKLKAKVDQPPRQPDRPRVNQDQDLARKEAREIEYTNNHDFMTENP